MKHRFLIFAAAIVLLLGLAVSCKKKESYENTSTSTTSTTATDTSATTTTTGTTATSAATTLSDDDKKFMEKAAQGSMAEVNLGQMAAQNGTSPDVKAFGNRMVTDHGKALDELKQLAQTKGVTLPADVSDSQKSEADKLSKKKPGGDFDKSYADTMADDHEKDVKEFDKASKDSKDPDLKAWAAKVLPIIQDHLKMAQDMKNKVKGEKK